MLYLDSFAILGANNLSSSICMHLAYIHNLFLQNKTVKYETVVQKKTL